MKRLRGWLATHLADLARGEEGQAIVWVAVMLPLFLSVIGLSIAPYFLH